MLDKKNIIKFEKVSYEQFKKDCERLGFECNPEIYNNILLPKRATSGSAGYDFYSPFHFNLKEITPQHFELTIPTGIRILLPKNKYLMCVPRSGLGFKYGIYMKNTLGIIDSDYYYSDNEGHIMCNLCQDNVFESYHFDKGERFMQGIIHEYFTTSDDNTIEIRNGGLGSTGSK